MRKTKVKGSRPQLRRNRLSVSLSVVAGEEQSAAVAVFVVFAAAAQNAVAAFVRSVVDGAARPAAFGLHRRFVLRDAGALFPVAVQVSAGLSLPGRTSFAAASDISGLASSYRCLEERVAQATEDHVDGQGDQDYCRMAR